MSSRRLDSVELALLRAERRTRLLELAALASAPLLAPPLLALVGLLAGAPAPAAAVLGMAAFIFGTAIALLRGRDLMRQRRWTLADIDAGLAFRFVRVPEPAALDANGEDLAAAAQRITTEFELLPASGRVWTIDGARRQTFERLPLAHVADIPRHAEIAAQWVRPVPYELPDAAQLHAGTRPLSASEIEELRRHSQRAWRRDLFPRGFWLLYGCVALSRWILGERVDALVVVAALSGLIALVRLAHGLRTSRTLKEDTKVGVVEIFRVETAVDELSPPVELLPVSRALWSEAGVPAAWRSSG